MNKRKTKKLFSFILAIILSFNLVSSIIPVKATNSFTLASGMKSTMDDSEEWVSDGLIDYNSSDLEIGYEKPTSTDTKQQIVAVRFAELTIPKGATITSAYIQFTADVDKDAGTSSKSTNPFDIKIYAEDTGNSAEITAAQYNISSRTLTTDYVNWNLSTDDTLWTTPYQCDVIQRTSDITSLVQKIVSKSDWASGNAMCFQLKGTGNRTAASSEDAADLSTGPVLHVTFDYDGTLDQAAPTGLTGIAPASYDNNDGQITGTTTAMEYKLSTDSVWTACTGTSITGIAAGTYDVRYAAATGYNAGASASVTVPAYAGYTVKDLTLQPGADATQMNFSWYSASTTTASSVQIALKSAMTGTSFPVSSASSFAGTVTAASASYNSNAVTVSGLVAATEYVYRVGDGTYYSATYTCKIQNSNNYNAIFVGDPQIGCSNTTTDTAGWQTTLTQALSTFSNTSFILSAGDQVETSTSETQYDGFFTPAELLSTPLVPTIGNHDNSVLYSYHFNSPNESTTYGTTTAGGDYYFTYGSTLYMVLNSNNQSATSHDSFISDAIAEAGSGIKWKVVMFHHSIYSSASHSTDSDILSRRSNLYPIFDKYDIDVVLAGHDHCYTRTFMMEGGIAQSAGTESSISNPVGTLYITANSASGSKYYDLKTADTAYKAYSWQGKVPSYSNIQVTDTAFTVTTYLSSDNTVIDTYTINKSQNAPTGLAGISPTSDTNTDGRITGTTTAMEYKLSTATTWTTCTGTSITGLASGTYDVRYADVSGSPSTPAVVVVSVYIPNQEQSAPTGLFGISPTTSVSTDGQITGTTTAMEYKLSTDTSWTTCTGTTITGLAVGTYDVRYAAKTGYNASPSTSVIVPSYYFAKDITLQPGADYTKMNFCWYSASTTTTSSVQVALKSAMTGTAFPVSSATTFAGTITASTSYNSNAVTVTGLAPSTEYVYRVGDGTSYGATYGFDTQNSSSYNAIFVGDPQIGCSNTTTDTASWQTTLAKALNNFTSTSFILSAGDQVETSTSETQYDGFFTPVELLSTPLVSTIGNHDNNALYSKHYNSPNESTTYGTTSAGGDYYFTYGSTLYMVLNSNNQSATSHDAFISEAITAAGSDIKWKVVMFHHSIYSSATHSDDADILSRRSDLYPIFDKYDIDVVLAGHDHCYTRTYQMLGGVAQTSQSTDSQGRVVNPTGTLYITANSASGSKYYDYESNDTAYMAYRWQGHTPSYSNIVVTDTTFAITTYGSDNDAIIDTYTIYKGESLQDQAAPTGLTGVAPTSSANNDGRITGTTSAMEYKLSTSSIWTVCAGSTVTGLLPGSYYVRYAAKEGFNASPSTSVSVSLYSYSAKNITLQPGADDTQMNFCWYSDNTTTASNVQIALKSAMTGTDFPVSSATTFTGTVSVPIDNTSNNSNEVTVTGLAASTEYVYRIGDGTSYSATYSFETKNSTSYNALFVGDPQIGCSNTATDTAAWQNTLTKALSSFSDTSFILSAGDQVEKSSTQSQYDGFFTPTELLSTPLVPTIGNHDNSALYSYHYNSPNESTTDGITDAGGDYYFTYGDTLYMVLNSNNQSATSHDAFISDAITAAGSDIKWKVVMFHHSIYSSASHSTDSDILSRRSDLYPIFDKYDIDVVLSGHDHCYTRSYQMLGGVAQTSQSTDSQGRVLNPTGTLYITANSASGSKYYDLKSADTAYMAYRWQGYTPSYSNIVVTDSTFTITTYQVDTGAVIDTYSIYKGSQAQDQSAPTGLEGIAPTTFGGSDGQITGTTAAMEYKLSTASEWTACTGTALTGLASAIYNVRYAATEYLNASEATDVTVPSGLTLTLGDEKTGGAGYQRSITVGNTTADLSGKYIVVQLTEGSGTSAKVSVMMISATDDEMTVSYQTAGTKIKAWLVSGMPNLTSSELGVTIYAYTSV